MLRIKCPDCGTVSEVKDSRRGKSVSCAACGCSLRIPAAEGKQGSSGGKGEYKVKDEEPDPRSKPAEGQQDSSGGKGGYRLKDEEPYEDSRRAPVEVPPREEEPDEPEPERRRRRKRQRKGREETTWLRYYAGALGGFGWSLFVLLVLSVMLGGLTFAAPRLSLLMMVLGGGMMGIGNLWILYVAYRDNPTYGVLAFTTCVFTYAYIFINLEETWRPVLLVVLGAVTAGSGWVLFRALKVSVAGTA
jgi:hypothetical protein